MSLTTTSGGTTQRSCAHKAIASAVGALGLVSTWNTATAQTATASTTIHIEEGVSLFEATNTATITGIAGAEVNDLNPGAANNLPVLFNSDITLAPNGVYSYLGVIDNGDGTSDLVMSFPGDGSAAVGVVWTALFVDNLPDEQRVFEPQVLQQLGSPPVFGADSSVPRDSQIGRVGEFFRDLTGTPYGESSTLIAFNGPGNTGVAVGSLIITPAPGVVPLLGVFVIGATSRRRRA